MKSSEFIRVDEGVGSWIKQGVSALGSSMARAGIGTKAQQIAAVGAQMQREKQALGQALGKENNNNFLKQLPKDIQSAINGSQIDMTGSGVGRTLEEFLNEYVATLFSNFNFDQKTKNAIDVAVKNFANEFKANTPRTPVLTGKLLTSAQHIWDSAKAGSTVSTNISSYGGTSSSNKVPYPTSNETLPLNTTTGPKTGSFAFDAGTKKWTKTHDASGVEIPVASRQPISDPTHIQQLNALAARI